MTVSTVLRKFLVSCIRPEKPEHLKQAWERKAPIRCRVQSRKRVTCEGNVSWLLYDYTPLHDNTKVTVKRVTSTHLGIVKQGWNHEN